MDRQQEFVLRTLEERDIRFVRLWFTDVLGYLKSVAIAPAELEGAFAEGIGFDGSAIEGFARVYESDMVAQARPVDLPGAAVGDRGRRALLGADVLRHHHAGRLAVLGRSPARAAPGAGRAGEAGLHLLRAPRDRVLPAARPAERRLPARARRQRRLLRPGQPRRRAALPPQRDRDAGVDGDLGGVQPPRGRTRPAGDRPALRRRADDGRQHHDVPVRGEGGRDHPGRARLLHAQAVHRAPGLGDAHPLQPVRGRPQRLPRRRRTPTSCPRPARRSWPACCGTPGRSPR